MKLRMPHAFTIVFSLVVIVAVLTYILPAGKYDTVEGTGVAEGKTLVIPNTYKEVESNPQGFSSVMMAFSNGLQDAAEVIAFVLIVGGAYGVILKTGAIESGLNRAIEKFGSKGLMIIPVLMFLFSIGGTTTGMAEETLPFYLILIPLMVALGYDAIVGIAVVLLGAGIGVLTSTVNPFATGIASALAEVSIADDLYLRLVMYVVSTSLAILYVLWYANRIKKDPKKSIVYDLRKDHQEHFLNSSKKVSSSEFLLSHKLILVSFAVMTVLMIYGLVSLGWWMGEITMLFLSVAFLSALLVKMNNNDFWEAFINGSKDLLSAALVIGLARAIVIVAQTGNIMDTILYGASELLSGLSHYSFIVLNEIVQIGIAFLVPSSSGHAALTMPIMAPLSDLFSVPREAVVTAYQSASGLVNLITPTSGVVMGALAIGRVNLGHWLKFMLPFLAMQFVVIIVFLMISVM